MTSSNEILKNYKNFLISRQMSINYANSMKLWLEYLIKHSIFYTEFTQQDITNFFLENPNHSTETKNCFIKAGKHFYGVFLQTSSEKNEWKKVKQLKVQIRKPQFITIEELNNIIHLIISYEQRLISPLKAEALIKFMYFTGLRKSELLHLKRADINLENDPCLVKVIGKGNKERFVRFSEKYSPNLKKSLINFFAREPENQNAFNITASQLIYLFQKMNTYIKTKHIHIHLLRHSFGKYLLSQGVQLPIIQKLYGHSSIMTTMRYLDPTEELIDNEFKDKK